MESNSGDASAILREIEALKATRNEIDSKISALEAQLREIKLQNGNDNGVLNNGSCPPISGLDSGFGHGLTPQMIYRYSRHLLLPSFGVQGSCFHHFLKLARNFTCVLCLCLEVRNMKFICFELNLIQSYNFFFFFCITKVGYF